MYTIEQFEKSILALRCGEISLQEVKVKKGKVREFIGLVDGKRTVWSATGEAVQGRTRRADLDITKALKGYVC